MKNLGFLIGRFQPLHAGHRSIIRQAAKLCKHLVVIVGSANAAPSVKNPWSYLERKTKIDLFLYHEEIKNVTVVPMNDYRYNNNKWQVDVENIITDASIDHNCCGVTMFGFDKPDNKYLGWFDHYEFVNLQSGFNVCATDVRNSYFKAGNMGFPIEVMEDYNYFVKEKEQFSPYPYLDTLNFCCSDSVVICNGHILLIKRIKAPGRNHWALPGGFKNNNETFLECAVRELIEETNLDVSENELYDASVINFDHVFDAPNRAAMGIPRITHAFLFKLATMPKVTPSDDALEAEWVPIDKCLNELPMHDDHRDIISTLTGAYPKPAINNRFITGV